MYNNLWQNRQLKTFKLNGHFHHYLSVRLVTFQAKIFHLEIVDYFDGSVELQCGKWTRFSSELFFQWFDVVHVDVSVTECMNKITRF